MHLAAPNSTTTLAHVRKDAYCLQTPGKAVATPVDTDVRTREWNGLKARVLEVTV